MEREGETVVREEEGEGTEEVRAPKALVSSLCKFPRVTHQGPLTAKQGGK